MMLPPGRQMVSDNGEQVLTDPRSGLPRRQLMSILLVQLSDLHAKEGNNSFSGRVDALARAIADGKTGPADFLALEDTGNRGDGSA